MKKVVLIGCAALALGLPMSAAAACPPDSVEVGPSCVDKFEASVWRIAPPLSAVERAVIRKIRAGTVTLADLTAASATQLGLAFRDLAAAGCFDDGNGCVDVYEVSIGGVQPSAFVTWFQALAAARNSHKRLPTNAEWQAAALGTPDPAGIPGPEDCNTFSNSNTPDPTGSRANCVSDTGAFDMVGNVQEWVAEWAPIPRCNGQWNSVIALTGDQQCFVGDSTGDVVPGALTRGGALQFGTLAGVFTVRSDDMLASSPINGFRAAR